MNAGGAIGRTSAIALGVMADALRRRLPYVVLLFAGLMAVAIPALPSYGQGVEPAVYREVALALTFVAALVVALSLTVNRVPGEVERRIVYPILARPVSRLEYLVGTWLGVAAVMAALIGAFTLIEQAMGLLNYGDPMWVLWQGAAGVWMEVCVLAAFAMAVSVASGAVAAASAALTFLFVGHSRAALLTEGSVLWALYPSLDPFNIITPVAHGSGVSASEMGLMSVAFLGWALAFLTLAGVAFAGKDL